MDRSEDSRRIWEYVGALEEERRKIHVFQRELPLCLQLVTHAIESCKQQLGMDFLFHGQSDSEASSREEPVLEEFIPLKRSQCPEDNKPNERDESAKKKPDWLRSVQLGSTQDTHSPPEDKEERREVLEPKELSGAFHPFSREENRSRAASAEAEQAPTAGASCTEETVRRSQDKEGQATNRKQRRCWSQELHLTFLQALQQLGGEHVATPKQIRELMRVDGLTNDEVKSHLQKYRLHKRRPSPTQPGDSCPQPARFVFVRGIWAPPPEYAGRRSRRYG